MDVVVASGLRPGLELDRPRLRRLRSELRRAEALATAGRLLRHRELAAERLEDELARRGIAPAERREAVGALARAGLVDDRRLALSRARSLADRGYGDEAIRWRLAQAGLAEGLAEEALAEIEPELERARRLVEREGLSPRTFRRLAARGFGQDSIEGAMVVADTNRSALR